MRSAWACGRRLGHASTETTQLYALLDDKVADAEIRAARRRETGQLADPPSTEQSQRNGVYLVTAVLPTPQLGVERWQDDYLVGHAGEPLFVPSLLLVHLSPRASDYWPDWPYETGVSQAAQPVRPGALACPAGDPEAEREGRAARGSMTVSSGLAGLFAHGGRSTYPADC